MELPKYPPKTKASPWISTVERPASAFGNTGPNGSKKEKGTVNFCDVCAVICMHLCLCKTLSQDCPHGKVAFFNSDINKKKCRIKICQIASFMSTMGKWYLMISFNIVDYHIMQLDDFFCYKDIGSKAYFTMATLLMPLLGNVSFPFIPHLK